MSRFRGIVAILVWSATIIASPVFGSFDDLVQVGGFAKGFAITADSLGLESGYKNPAGISSIQTKSVMTTYTSQFGNLVQTMGLALGAPISEKIKVSLNVPLTITQDNPETVGSSGRGVQVGSFSNYITGAITSISTSLYGDHLQLGVSAVYRHLELNKTTANGFGLDAGLILNTRYISLGLSAQDIGGTKLKWSNDTEETIQARYNIGVKIPVEKMINILADATIESDKENVYNIGAEVNLSKNFSLMGGIRDIQGDSNWRVGTCVKVKRFNIYYSFSNHQELGVNHKIGIQFL